MRKIILLLLTFFSIQIGAVGNNHNKILHQNVIDVKSFGAKGDGTTDDTEALQKAINVCIQQKKSLYLSRPSKSYIATNRLLITGQIYIYGDGMSMCGINFINSNGFEIAEGIKNVIIEKISINQAIRHTNKANRFIAIDIKGSGNKRSYTHIYRDVFIDGFYKAFNVSWLWDSLFDNIKILYGNIGIEILGTSVNNNITNSSISVEGEESKAIYFSDGIYPSEGWKITNLLTFGADYGIYAVYTSNVYVVTPILDFCKKNAIRLVSSSKGPSVNWQILGGYIAMSGEGLAAIYLDNNVNNNQIRGNIINNVDILAYPKSNFQAGILVNGKYDINHRIIGNIFTNFVKATVFKNGKEFENYFVK